MAKIMRSVTLEFEVWAEAKRRNVNISEACERGLMVYGERRGEETRSKLERVAVLLSDREKARFGNQVRRFENWKPRDASVTKSITGVTTYVTADLEAPPSPYDDVRKRIRALVGVSLTEHDVRELFMKTPPS